MDRGRGGWFTAAIGHRACAGRPRRLSGAAPVRAPLAERPLGNRRSRWPGAPLTTLLRTDGIEVIVVPAKRAARVRVLSSGHGRKNDDADALSVGIAALTSHALGTAEIDAATTALRADVEHRDDLVKTRTQTVNRLHVVLARLVPAGARRHLSADHAAELLCGVRPRDAAAKTLPLAMDLVRRCASSIAGSPRPPMISRWPSAHPAPP